MNTLKIALKLTPLSEVAIETRRLDVKASPYDATAIGEDNILVLT